MLTPASGPTLALRLPTTPNAPTRHGYQVNVLGSSLVSRLKQAESQAKHAGKTQKKTATRKSVLRSRDTQSGEKYSDVAEVVHFQCLENEDTASSTYSITHRQNSRNRLDSIATTSHGEQTPTRTLPRIQSSNRSITSCSRAASRRSLSAGPGAGASMSAPIGRPINVVKKDGVFQPADKYLSGRLLIRDGGGPSTTLCDYLTYVLSDDAKSLPPESPRARVGPVDVDSRGSSPEPYLGSGNNKKRAKVSWKANSIACTLQAERPDGCPDSRQGTLPTPSMPDTPATLQSFKQDQRRAQSVDNLAFRRPVYTKSGRSRVSSIGLNWQIPAVSSGSLPDDARLATNTPSSAKVDGSEISPQPLGQQAAMFDGVTSSGKPMWSYLITRENQGRTLPQRPLPPPPPRKKASDKLVPAKPTPSRHSRDIHPVSTARQQAGSNSSDQWTVPSITSTCTDKRLEMERTLRERVLLIKQPSQYLIQTMLGTESWERIDASKRFRRAMVAAGRGHDIDDNNKENADDDDDDGEEEERKNDVEDGGEIGFEKGETRQHREADGEKEGSNISQLTDGRYGKVQRDDEGLTQGTASVTFDDDKATSTRDDDGVSSPTKSRSTYCN